MKYITDYKEFLFEKVDIKKYLPKIGKSKIKDYPIQIKAFLDVIAFAEGTFKYENSGYNTIFTGKQFKSYEDHPRQIINNGGLRSSAAGRYQFLSKTWDGIMRGKSFTPKNQDKGAIKLLKRRKSYRPLLKGDIKKALYNSRKEWASFPWSPYGQGAWFAKNDEDKYKVLSDLYWYRLKELESDSGSGSLSSYSFDITELSNKEEERLGSKKRSKVGFSGGDALPFVVGESYGNNVSELQKALVNLGGSLPIYGIDGLFGSETIATSNNVLVYLYKYKKINKKVVNNKLSKDDYDLIVDSSSDLEVTKYLNKNMIR